MDRLSVRTACTQKLEIVQLCSPESCVSRSDKSRSDYVPNWACPEVTMYRIEYVSKNVVHRSGHIPKRPEPPAQWRLVLVSKEPNFVTTAIAKLYAHFKVSNVNKVAIFPERTNTMTDTTTNTHPNNAYYHVRQIL